MKDLNKMKAFLTDLLTGICIVSKLIWIGLTTMECPHCDGCGISRMGEKCGSCRGEGQIGRFER